MAWGRRKSWQESLQDRMGEQLTSLRREVAALGRSSRRYGHDIGEHASDLGDQLWHGGEAVARVLGKQAKKAGRAVKDDPVPAVVAVLGFAAFLNLVLGRKR